MAKTKSVTREEMKKIVDDLYEASNPATDAIRRSNNTIGDPLVDAVDALDNIQSLNTVARTCMELAGRILMLHRLAEQRKETEKMVRELAGLKRGGE